MKVLDAFSSIGGFAVFCHYAFSIFASYLNKWLYLSDLMQQRYIMHKNVDIDHAGDSRGRYAAQFDEMRAEEQQEAVVEDPTEQEGGEDIEADVQYMGGDARNTALTM